MESDDKDPIRTEPLLVRNQEADGSFGEWKASEFGRQVVAEVSTGVFWPIEADVAAVTEELRGRTRDVVMADERSGWK